MAKDKDYFEGLIDDDAAKNSQASVSPGPVRKRSRIYAVITALVVVVLFIACAAGFYLLGRNSGSRADLPMLEQAYELMRRYYYKDITWEEFDKMAAAGLLSGGDYSGMTYVEDTTAPVTGFEVYTNAYREYVINYVYKSATQDRAYNALAKGYTTSIDVTNTGGVYNISTSGLTAVPDGVNPRLQAGDVIYAVNGVRVQNTSYYNAALGVKCAVDGNAVNGQYILHVLKYDTDGNVVTAEDGKPCYFLYAVSSAAGDDIEYASYYSPAEIGSQDTGLIAFRSFDDKSAEDFAAAARAFMNDPSANKLIVDLRYNGGGAADVMGYIASYLIDISSAGEKYKGTVTNGTLTLATFRYNAGYDTDLTSEKYFTTLPSTEKVNITSQFVGAGKKGYELTFLCNSNTASSSELLIHSGRFYQNARVVGDTTYGKGVAQSVFEIDGKYLMYIANGYYYLPRVNNGVVSFDYNIDGTGLAPDVVSIAERAHEIRPYAQDETVRLALES